MPRPGHLLPRTAELLGGDGLVGGAFLLEIDGVEIGLFGTVRGLEVTSTTEDVIEGGQNGYVHKLPGRFTWPNIVLSRGITEADALMEWMQKTSGEKFESGGNKLARTSGAISALLYDGTRLRSWVVRDMFPVRWKGPDFDAASNSTLTEELEIAHHGFEAWNR